MSTIIVTGGRDYGNADRVNQVLDNLNEDIGPLKIVQGGASGADRLAALWAHKSGHECVTVQADWAKHGRSAGPIRNRQMIDLYPPHYVVAFPGGRGTADMVNAAKQAGIPALVFNDALDTLAARPLFDYQSTRNHQTKEAL